MAEQVVGRFFVGSLTRMANGGWASPKPKGTVKMGVCTRGPENKSWATATPSGSIEMMLTESGAWSFFEGAMDDDSDIEVTFRKVPKVTE